MNTDRSNATALPNLALLEIEVDTLWARDPQGRLLHARDHAASPAPYVVVAVSDGEYFGSFSAGLPGDILTECWSALLTCDLPPTTGSAAGNPPEFNVLKEIFARHGVPAKVHCGPSYLVPETVAAIVGGALVTSASATDTRGDLYAPAGANWEPDEWRALLAGEMGPWAMAVEDDEIASICHSARLSGQAAEAGLRTEPAVRHRGHGAAATAAWAALVHEGGRLPFYSTSADNLASQAVANRLKLQLIGWIWSLHPPG